MLLRWTQRRSHTTNVTRGYDIEQVDAFLAYVGSEHAYGVRGDVLAREISEARFTMVNGGYDPQMIDRHLAKLHRQLASAPLAAAA